ncbi:MAG: DNA-directed RNA polymerase subunit beta [Thermodesulfobacteriota bacterium]
MIKPIRVRKNFAKTMPIMEPPHLIEMQRTSFESFLQMKVPPEDRENKGLEAVFRSVFPISDFNDACSLEYVRYAFGEPKYSVDECMQRGMTYEVPVKITVRLVAYNVDAETGVKSIRDIKEQEVYLGSIPLMTKTGVFVINGTERVIVSQLQRSPGLFFSHDAGRTHSSGKLLYSARLIPVRGSWIDFEFDSKDILYVRIDRRRKFPVTTFLKALGFRAHELLHLYYQTDTIQADGEHLRKVLQPERLVGQKAPQDLVHPTTGEVIVKKNRKISRTMAARLAEAGIDSVEVDAESLVGKIVATDLAHPVSGERIVGCNEPLTANGLQAIRAAGIASLDLLSIDGIRVSDSFQRTLALDRANTPEEALVEIYRRLRPSSPPTLEVASTFFNNLFFNPDTYDLSEVGRYKLREKLGLDVPISHRVLTREDIIEAVRQLLRLKDEQGPIDDIDHLGNRRVRTVGELVENQYRVGLVRMERAIKERLSLQEVEALMPHDLINPKPVSSAIKEFFGTSQLSQFMDQTNPLSEVTHKRRLSALGPGGLSRERAGFEVRDVHPTHYGRICPVETPEGPNIGLIVSLATYARINPFGFIETPYQLVSDRKVTSEVRFMTATDEAGHSIAPAKVRTDKAGKIIEETLFYRVEGEVTMGSAESLSCKDVSPNQLVSVAASLVPFLENDDANRALMGSNMQRQAVPLLVSSAPLVGTGLELTVARDSGVCLLAGGEGVVEESDANRVVVRYDQPGTDGFSTGVAVYRLNKYKKSNQNTCFNQIPRVLPGTLVKKGDVLADGPSCERGELALGQNVTVAFMPWNGYNFEDSILISERLVQDDVFTSIHIEEFDIVARDTKLGREEITRDIPNVGEEALRNLDESGIVRIGAEVRPGDTLVGKVTPKGETQLSPEEKLLRAIFGEKAGDVKDTSLRVPPGVQGIVIDTKVFSRRGVEKDERAQAIEDAEVARLRLDQEDEVRCLRKGVRNRLQQILMGRTLREDLRDGAGKIVLRSGAAITATALTGLSIQALRDLEWDGRDEQEQDLQNLVDRYHEQVRGVEAEFEARIGRLRKGDDLPPGVIKMVKVYVATKRKLAVGDKMAGRHGNKGVVSRVLPVEDMPYFEDGAPVDLVLNPLGVPSRMNVGQVLETHLGLAARQLGQQLQRLAEGFQASAVRQKLKAIYAPAEYQALGGDKSDEEILELCQELGTGLHMASPVFDGASEDEIRRLLVESGSSEMGQVTLYDGLTGEPFDNKVTVGVMYMLKLHHLVDDKIHARSTGPYSLVTQQPLGGKAQFGGQRLGEMEVWAMEAYGAAYSLQEFLTVKSDDVSGRTKMYEKIVKGNNFLESGLPESFHVLVKELQGLCLDVDLGD